MTILKDVVDELASPEDLGSEMDEAMLLHNLSQIAQVDNQVSHLNVYEGFLDKIGPLGYVDFKI